MSESRAVGVIRVSRVGKREGEHLVSPTEQRDRIEAECERQGYDLVHVYEELDVSGGKPLAKRPGLSGALEMIEAGEAEILMVAYLDRLARSLETRSEVLRRLGNAKAKLWAVDTGEQSEESAGQWLSGAALMMVAEYQLRSMKERSGNNQAKAVERGVAPWSRIPPGYRRGGDGCLVPDPLTRKAVAQAFQMRADGSSLTQIRDYLNTNGVYRTWHSVQSMLKSRAYIGEVNFGQMVNLTAHEPLISRELFDAVTRRKISRGRHGKSDRLLARLGVLRCHTCKRPMMASSQTQNYKGKITTYHRYVCQYKECTDHQVISCRIVEGVVTDKVREYLSDADGKSTAENRAAGIRSRLEATQSHLDGLIAFYSATGTFTEPSAVGAVTAAREERDAIQAELDELPPSSRKINVNVDWDLLDLDERRDLIATVVTDVTIRAGSGAGRVSVSLLER